MDAFFHIKSSLGKKNRLAETPEEVFLPLVRMMTLKLHQSLDQDKQNRFFQIWTRQNSEQKGPIESYFPNNSEMTDTELPSQRTIEHKNIQKKIKPGTKNDRLLLEYVKYVTMIDWTNAEKFKDLPLLPEDFTWPELAQVIGEGKQIGPLFHYSGFLPYTMQTVQKYPNCQLRKIYKTYPPASWPHAFSCAHGCQNIYNESGRLATCKNVMYTADSFIENPSDDFSKWVQNQKDVLFLEKNKKIPTTISLFSMTMRLNISRRCQVNTRLKQPYQ